MPSRRLLVLLSLPLALAACGDDPPPALTFAAAGSTSADSGRGSFTFGAASAATQIEDQNPNSDWYLWTAPEPEGLAKSPFVGEAARGFTKALEDVELAAALGLDSYRFSIEWSRIEPQRGVIDEAALAHYDGVIDALIAAGIEPMVTIHHFSSPVWVDDPRLGASCPDGPSDDNLCGWHNDNVDEVIAEIAEHARLLATRYGDRVDDWCTVNEPVNYLLASHGVGVFPPGRNLLLADFPRFMQVARNYIRAHVAIYDAIKEADTVDADDDGIAASVGLTLNVAEWTPARDNVRSDDPEDIAAVERVKFAYHYLFVEAILQGKFDSDLDQVFETDEPTWTGKLDWLGVQYYSRVSVSADRPLIPGVMAMVCFGGFDLGSCLAADEPTHWVPTMQYEYYEPGIYNVLRDFSARWPSLPLTVTESGLATEVGRRRAEHVVRSLEQIARARDEGVDVRGYYHWSLTDNFEWAEGFEPRFGLYRVDYGTYERTATEGADVLRDIATSRAITGDLRASHGGLGPMTPEE
ncbi:MAG TPA: family 1 glycosylhydrolase [Kofleriaceae bacterium]|nr:family 1 glycosylhydrolase [Kofleriaceae bacterium]